MTAWRKSSFSTGAGGTTDCVEVARLSNEKNSSAVPHATE
ncbi:MAG: DUF397 domain-containing protein [Actinoallomurus sp.]